MWNEECWILLELENLKITFLKEFFKIFFFKDEDKILTAYSSTKENVDINIISNVSQW